MTDDTRGNTPDPQLPSDATIPSDSQPGPGRALGPYVLRELIGSGGMGEVWRAEQTAPVKRTVALKLIKAGMDSREVLARFEAERQALALMDHPCIAKVFDAGMTPQGRPYFAMEYVKGVPLTEYCDRRRMSTHDRLKLFQQICQGVQHAHQKAVLHRDLKPSNVLVTDLDDKPQPKIIDFGVAKATTQKLTEKTMYTALGQLIGTPEYMSPEQAELTGEDVDTRTDVYSLGVILYELLSGTLPFAPEELRQAGFEGIVRVLREQDPLRPSTRVSTPGEWTTQVAKERSTGPRRLVGQLRGDMDWIVMRCLEKDRNRRYSSPQELAQDIERHLKDEPVLAGPPSAVYRTRKFIRRHRIGVTIAAATLVVLVGFATTMAVQSQRIATERDRANQEAEAAERVSEFLAQMLGDIDAQRFGNSLLDDLQEQVAVTHERLGLDPADIELVGESFATTLQGVNRADLARQILDAEILQRAAESIEAELDRDPLIAARLYNTLGETYLGLGLYEPAQAQFEKAVEIRREALGYDAPPTLESRQGLAVSLHESRLEASQQDEPVFQEIYEQRLEILGPEHPQTLESLVWCAEFERIAGRYARAGSLQTLVMEVRARVLGAEDPKTIEATYDLARDLQNQERWAESESLRIHMYARAKQSLGIEDPLTLRIGRGLAVQYDNLDKFIEAAALHEEILRRLERVQGLEHDETIWERGQLAHVYEEHLYRFAEAEVLRREVIAARQHQLGPGNPRTARAALTLAKLMLELERYDTADSIMQATRIALTENHGASSATVLRFRYDCAFPLGSKGYGEEAIARFQRLIRDQQAALGETHPHVADSMYQLALTLRTLERYEDAEPYLRRSLEITRSNSPESAMAVARASVLSGNCQELGKLDEAEEFGREALDLGRRILGEDHRFVQTMKARFAKVLVKQGRVEEARPYVEEYLAAFRGYAQHRTRDLHNHAWLLMESVPESFRDIDEVIDYAERANELTEYRNPYMLDNLARAYFEAGRTEDASQTEKRAISAIPVPCHERSLYMDRLAEYEAESR